MKIRMLKGKIHRAAVTQAELNYVGSITVDSSLLEAAGILEYEMVQIVDVENGNRFETYTIAGEAGSGMICLNGAAARQVQIGDHVIIMAYADMTVEEAVGFFENVPSIRRKIETLNDVGLSYIKLGQPSTTLSGGEAQRIKLATELSKRSTGKTIYILDEPTTGLHFADVHKLTEILQRLADGGNTVVVIEHNLDVIKTADYIIDIGPEGGDKGGTVIASGTPEEVAGNKDSYTGIYVKKMLERARL